MLYKMNTTSSSSFVCNCYSHFLENEKYHLRVHRAAIFHFSQNEICAIIVCSEVKIPSTTHITRDPTNTCWLAKVLPNCRTLTNVIGVVVNQRNSMIRRYFYQTQLSHPVFTTSTCAGVLNSEQTIGHFAGALFISSVKKSQEYLNFLDNSTDFTHIINTTIFHGITPNNCSTGENVYCLHWGDLAEFKITKLDDHCESFGLKSEFNEPLGVIFNVSGIHLYGGDEVDNQSWPLKTKHRQEEAFVSKEYNSEAVLESIWYTSTGFYLYVSPNVPLFVQFQNETLHLMAKRKPPYLRGNITVLDYRICKYDNVKEAFKHAIADTLGQPVSVPSYQVVELPIWSTWAKFKTHINQSVVLEFAESISSHLFPNSQLDIDDGWESCYGSLTVDTGRFPDMKRLVRHLHAKGFKVVLWVHPFVNADCHPYFTYGVDKKYYVRSRNGSVLTQWWNGICAHVDFTNPEAASWYETRLKRIIAETGVDSFKFDAGESSWLPQVPLFSTNGDDHPETNLKMYVHVASSFGRTVEVRSARQTQQYPVFVRMLDRESQWTGRLAASTLIPTLLHMNLIGYPFVLPDMVGGNGYGTDVLTEELFIRWLQITVFMPSLQFSYPPWNFSDKAVNITHKLIDLHKHYAPTIFKLMEQATKEPTMVNAPLWWIDPTDPVTFTIDSEYLLGDEILVAPILEKGATSRSIYFPKGVWRDETNSSAPLITGPTWVSNYPADLEVLPYFSRISSRASAKSFVFSILTALIASVFLSG